LSCAVVDGASHPGPILDQHYAKITTRALVDVAGSARCATPLTR
jgi:hypothetical protein